MNVRKEQSSAGSNGRASTSLRRGTNAHAALALESDTSRMSASQMRELVHELRIHQRQLEMQNEELRDAQVELAKSRDRFNHLYHCAPVGYVTMDEFGMVAEANVTFFQMVGLASPGLIGRRFSRMVAMQSQDTFHRHHRAVLGSKLRYDCEVMMRRADGTEFPASIQSICEPELVRGRFQWRTAVVDITERKQAEEAVRGMNVILARQVAERTETLSRANQQLQNSEQALADLFAEATIGLLWVDAEGNVLRMNRAQSEILGYSEEELIRHPIAEFHADPQACLAMLHELAQRKAVRNQQASVLHKDGATRDVLVDANGLWQRDRLLHTRWFMRDITQRKRLEREILEISERERQQMGLDLHDELCQQLTSIEFLTRALERSLQALSPSETTRAAEISRLTRNAISYTRSLSRGLFPAELLTQGLMEALQELAHRSSSFYNVQCRFAGHLPLLVRNKAAQIHLYRIAQEAVRNAVKHGQAGEIDIHLRTARNQIILTVQDNGSGLPATLPTGKGLGLEIMKHRASVLGGSLAIRKSRGGQTVVACSVPIPLLKAPGEIPHANKVNNQ